MDGREILMPKRVFKFKGFYGGINNAFSPRDLSPLQVTEAQDINLGDLGRVTLMGGEVAHDMATKAGRKAVQNTGLFYYATDRREGADPHATPHLHELGEDWILYPDGGGTRNRIYKFGAFLNNVSGDWIDLDPTASGATDFEPVYYAVDGGLRVSDGNFSPLNSNKWHGYIKRTHFSDASGKVDYDDWVTKDQALLKPTAGIYGSSGTQGGIQGFANSTGSTTQLIDTTSPVAPWGTDIQAEFNTPSAGVDYKVYQSFTGDFQDITAAVSSTELTNVAMSGTWNTRLYTIYPPPGLGFNISVTSSASVVGTWTADEIEFASSFIYDGSQESLLYKIIGGGFTPTVSKAISVVITATGPYNARISGGKIYYRNKDSDEQWNLFVDISLSDGCRANSLLEYSSWSGASPSYLSASIYSANPNAETYEILNGFSPEQEDIAIGSLGMGYKCACVAGNRKAYVAHVRMKDEDGKTITRGDLMLKSKANKFDTFLWEDRVEVSINDGDDITALVSFGDRILQFKKKKMYLLNVSQDIEFLEDQFPFRGIQGLWQVCMTEMGPAWFNEQGMYLYNGQSVIDLTEDQKIGQKKFDWEVYFSSSTITNLSIGYAPKSKQILIVENTGDQAFIHSILVYDIRTQSFVKGYRKVGTLDGGENYMTNLINDWDNDLAYAVIDRTGNNLYFKKWNISPTALTTDKLELITRAEDFGSPDVRKIAYKVNVTHNANTGAAAALALFYKIDDFEAASGFTEVDTFDSHGGDMELQEFEFASPITDFTSMQLAVAVKTTGTVEAGFSIDEMSIVIREKIVA